MDNSRNLVTKFMSLNKMHFRKLPNKLIFIIFLISISLIITDVFMKSDSIEYITKKAFLFNNRVIFIFSIFFSLVIFFFVRKFRIKNDCQKPDRYYLIIFSSIVLFIIQNFITYYIYFYPGWDAGAIRSTVFDIINNNGVIGEGNQFYWYSLNPNNLNLTGILLLIEEASIKLGLKSYYPWLIVNIFFVNLAGIFTYLSARNITKDKVIAYVSWLFFSFLISLSPWVSIPYSDTYAILFPILSFYLYVTRANNQSNNLRWFLIGFFSFLGYTIKPTSIIILIVIFINESIQFQHNKNCHSLERKCGNISILLLSIIPIMIINNYLVIKTGSDLDANRKLSPLHYLMMGLNSETLGVYSGEDVSFSASFYPLEERNKANINKIQERLENFGFFGYIDFLSKKALVNFSDGSFAWGAEGNFFEEIPYRNNKVSTFLSDLFYPGGWFYQIYLTIAQLFWFTTFLLLLGAFLSYTDEDYKVTVVVLSILGIIGFVMAFEARARYLINHLPFFTIGAGIGISNITKHFVNK